MSLDSRFLASQHPELVLMAEINARFTNPQCWYDLANMPEDARDALLSTELGAFESQFELAMDRATVVDVSEWIRTL